MPPGTSPDNPYGSAPGTQESSKPKTFADMAQVALRQGRDQDALQYLFSHAVTAEAGTAKELLSKMGWVEPLRRPVLALRWGVGIEYVGPRGYQGSIYPIGTTQTIQTKRALGGKAAGGFGIAREGDGYGQGTTGGGQAHAQFQQLTGELGQKLVQRIQERMARSDFGEVLAAALPGKPSGPDATSTGAEMGCGGGQPGAPSGPMAGGYPVATGMSPPSNKPGEAQSLLPGILFLGQGTSKDLRKKAEEAQVDLLCVFNVAVTLNPRLNRVINDTTILLRDPTQPKEIFRSKKLNNVQVQIGRAEQSFETDPVDKEFADLFQVVDSKWRLGQLPPNLQTQEGVLNRLRALIGATHENPLPVLAEARMYHTRGLLQDHHLTIAYQKILAVDQLGTQLATGSEQQKKKVIEKWLPREISGTGS
jgi:hypothetical protein